MPQVDPSGSLDSSDAPQRIASRLTVAATAATRTAISVPHKSSSPTSDSSLRSTSSLQLSHQKAAWTLAAAALALGVAWLASTSRLAQESNLDIEDDFKHIYVQTKVGAEHKCSVSGRGGATTRRAEPSLAGARWKCRWLRAEDGSDTLSTVTGKEPSYLFVPASAVIDPALPAVYEQVRQHLNDQGAADEGVGQPLPRLRWVHLFWNRRYRGLMLQVRLPDKKFAEDHGLGRVEIMTAKDDRMWCFTRKLDAACTLWNEAFIAESLWPRPVASPELRWLQSLVARAQALDTKGAGSMPAASFYLAETGGSGTPGGLLPLPLPFDMAVAVGDVDGRGYVDARYRTWTGDGSLGVSSPEWWARAERPDAQQLRDSLGRAFEVGCDVADCSADELMARLDRSPSLAALEPAAGGDV